MRKVKNLANHLHQLSNKNMPRLIEHIDAIARKKQRGVFILEFHPEQWDKIFQYEYKSDSVRSMVIDWLDEQHIHWEPCGWFASETTIMPYLGEVYLDIQFDESCPDYLKLQKYLEHPDGSMRIENVRFCYLTLENAMRNSHHDDPGFWEQWAEAF